MSRSVCSAQEDGLRAKGKEVSSVMSEEHGEITMMPRRWDDLRSPWSVDWGGVWVGALAAFAAVLLFGLVGVALGAQHAGPPRPLLRWSDFGSAALIFSVFGAFLSFVIG